MAERPLNRPNEGSAFWTRLTPPGSAALASFGLRGSGASRLLAEIFVPAGGRTIPQLAPGDVAFGRVAIADDLWEEAVVAKLGPEEWELHTHGGPAVTRAVACLLESEGGQELTACEWTRASVADPLAADALVALGQARTDRTAQLLLDQYRGALARELEQLAEQCEGGKLADAAERLAALRSRWTLGRHLTSPWKVVLAGRPNAGKSSLLNALAGYERAIVFPEPGTTRDLVTCSIAVDGWPVELIDMAGLRSATEAIEAAGIERAWRALAGADVVLLVVDRTVGWDDRLWEEVLLRAGHAVGKEPLQAGAAPAHCLVVYNKADLPGRVFPPDPPGVVVSARTGQGLDALLEAMARCLVPVPPQPGTAIPFTEAQATALAEAEECLAAGDGVQAARRLRRLRQTGR
jgi:tRNA modification GTPase